MSVNIEQFADELQIIDDLRGLESTTISIYEGEELLADGMITRKDGKNLVEISEFLDDIKNAKFKTKLSKPLYTSLERVSRSANCVYSFNPLKSNDFPDNFRSKFRCFIPTGKSQLKSFHSFIKTIYSSDCVQLDIDSLNFDLLQIERDQQGYYVVDSFQEMTFVDFGDYCYAIQQALGFIMGYMPGGNIFYFSEDKDFYYTNNVRPAMKALHYPIHTNPYQYTELRYTSADDYKKKLDLLPARIFSNLVEKIKSDSLLSSTIAMMIEAESVRSLLLMPGIYSIALETLSKIICPYEEPKEGDKNPIGDKSLFKKISRDLKDVIDFYVLDFELNDDIDKLKNRIDNLNKPINMARLSNNKKLQQPFIELGVKLSKEDINIINHRNDLLHGNIHLSNEERQEGSDPNKYMQYTSEKLYTLVCSLILKYVGYNGYIINYAKLCEKDCKITTDEDYYILI